MFSVRFPAHNKNRFFFFFFFFRNWSGNFEAHASKVEVKTGNRDSPLAVDLLDLERENLPNLDNLSQLGFFKLFGQDFVVEPSFDHNSKTVDHNSKTVEHNSKTVEHNSKTVDHNSKTVVSSPVQNNKFETQKKKLMFLDLKLLHEEL